MARGDFPRRPRVAGPASIFANMEHHHAAERPAYSYLRIRNKIFPWGGDCGLFEYGKCQEE